MFKIDHIRKSKIGLIMLSNMLGPVFDLCLDQFLTFKVRQCLVIFGGLDFY